MSFPAVIDLEDITTHHYDTPAPAGVDTTPLPQRVPGQALRDYPLGPPRPIDPPGLPAPKHDLARITQLTNEVVALAAEVPGQLAELHRAVYAARIARGEA